MCRRAQSGLVAMFMFAAIAGVCITQSPARGQTIATRRTVYLPLVTATNALASPAELEALTLINQYRAANGCPPVQLNAELHSASQQHSQEMADKSYFSHTGWDGSTFVERAIRAKYQFNPSGEIIAGGQSTPAGVVAAWMKSDTHRPIILTCANDDIGVGFVSSPKSQWRYYWTAVFGAR